jgi:hypothetical protein
MESDDNEAIIPFGKDLTIYSISAAINKTSSNLSNLELRGDMNVVYSNNGFNFNDLVFVGVPGTSSSLSITST